MFEAKEISVQNNHWIAFVFLAVLFLLAIVKVTFKERLACVSIFFFSKRELMSFYKKEKNKIFSSFQFIFFIIEVLSILIFSYLIIGYFKLPGYYNTLEGYLTIITVTLLYFLLHYVIGLFISQIFNFKKEFYKIAYFKSNYFNNIILWLLPFLLLSSYQKNNDNLFVKITLILAVILLLLRYLLVLINNKKLIYNNLFYFILYICALEIAPILIVIKLIN